MRAAGDHIVLNVAHAGQVLKKERQIQELSQRAMAALVGSDQSNVSHWENGVKSITLRNFIKYAHALGYDVMLTPKR
jgi:transcriptional regulator with XRE-family HTH domain